MAFLSSRKLARACADFLWRQDATLRSLDLERLSIEAGGASVAMIVLPSMVNGIGITHGGAIFTLADAVFSLACNSYNERTVTSHCSIAFLRPTRLGDRLVATATEVVRSERSGIYDVRVSLEDTVVAEFRAHSRVIGGSLLPPATAGQG
jgi:acyl-CoA thioesterase